MDGQRLNVSELPDDELIALMFEVLTEVEARLMCKPVESGENEN